jgi:hypothetical protein
MYSLGMTAADFEAQYAECLSVFRVASRDERFHVEQYDPHTGDRVKAWPAVFASRRAAQLLMKELALRMALENDNAAAGSNGVFEAYELATEEMPEGSQWTYVGSA